MANLNVINASVEVQAQEVKGSQEPKAMVQSRLVYYVSRLKETRKGVQIRLGEYVRKGDDMTDIKALATLHMKHKFLSGMPAAFVTANGTFWSTDRKEKDQFIGIQLNFTDAQMLTIEKQLTEGIKAEWMNPPKKDSGVSDLRGYQLHVNLKPGAMARIQMENNDVKMGKENLILEPSEVESITVVTADNDNYAHRGHQVQFDAFVETFFNSAEENTAKTPEQVKALLSRLHADAKEGRNVKNRYRRGNKAMEASQAETKVTTTEEMG